MGLMEKFKNLFTDEEIIEEEDDQVQIKEIKKEEEKTKEHKLPTFMREKIEKEEKEKKEKAKKAKEKTKEKEQKEEEPEPPKKEKKEEEFKPMDADITEEKQSTFKFPVFEDSDFIEPTRASRHTIHVEEEVKTVNINKPIEEEPKINILETKVSKLYKDKEPEEEIKRFKASPIISPIFGVLDKNYIPSDVATRKGGNYEISRHSKMIDFDSVRKKAYETKPTLEEDIKDNLMCENCEYLKKAKECKKNKREINDDNNLMYEALCEKDDEDLTLDEAAENYFDYGVAYEKKQDIDPIYLEEEPKEEKKETVKEEVKEEIKEKKEDKKEEVKIVNHAKEEKEKKKDIPPVKSSINLLSTINKSMDEEEPKEKDLELTDDLFNLIDSMYDERDD